MGPSRSCWNSTTSALQLEKKSGNLFNGGVMVIVVGNGHGDTSSNPGRD